MKTKILFCKHHFPDLVCCANQFGEEEVMLALEEYWHIIQGDPTCGALNEKIVRMIEDPDSFTTSDLTGLHLEEKIIEKRISDYFGCRNCCSGTLSQLQKDSDSYKRGQFLKQVIFKYIIEICRLRHGQEGNVPVFEMPEQDLKVLVNIEKETCSAKPLSLSLKVRKYHPFSMHITLKQEWKDDISLDIEGKINHYYWNPVLKINLPLEYPLKKGEFNLYDVPFFDL